MGICFLFLAMIGVLNFLLSLLKLIKNQIYARICAQHHILSFKKLMKRKDIEFYLSKYPNDKAGQKLKSAIDQLKK